MCIPKYFETEQFVDQVEKQSRRTCVQIFSETLILSYRNTMTLTFSQTMMSRKLVKVILWRKCMIKEEKAGRPSHSIRLWNTSFWVQSPSCCQKFSTNPKQSWPYQSATRYLCIRSSYPKEKYTGMLLQSKLQNHVWGSLERTGYLLFTNPYIAWINRMGSLDHDITLAESRNCRCRLDLIKSWVKQSQQHYPDCKVRKKHKKQDYELRKK